METSTIKFIALLEMKEISALVWSPKTYLNTNRTFNPYNYENEVDDYGQTHFQLHYNELN